MTGKDIKAKSAVDEEGIKFADTTNDHGLEEGQAEQTVGVWVSNSLPSLLRLPLFLLDTLIIASDPFDEFGLGGIVCPPDFGWRIG